MATPDDPRYRTFEAAVKQMVNTRLKEICKNEGLLVSGVKAELQKRILDLAKERFEADPVSFETFRAKVLDKPSSSSPSYNTPGSYSSASYGARPPQFNPGGFGRMPYHAALSMPIRLQFKNSPFYTIQRPLGNMGIINALPQSRSSVQGDFTITQPDREQISKDPSLRVMLFCAQEPPRGVQIDSDIAFPAHIELRCNGVQFQGNLRGIKKKPGTTRPADLTDSLNLYRNPQSLVLSYASTERKHQFVVQLVKKYSPEDLVERIRNGRYISKQSVINEMVSKASDADIVATSTVMSLKCPLSAKRMALPCRSSHCRHNQCFDAISFMQLQEQAPQWSCPTCNKTVAFDDLAVDQYVQDVLNYTSKNTEQVTVEPNGQWRMTSQRDKFKVPNGSANKKQVVSYDLEDGLEILDHRFGAIASESSTASSPARHTPFGSSSREASAAGSVAPSGSSNKRPAREIIDLTSDTENDEDQPPRRPVKRQSTGSFATTASASTSYPQTPTFGHDPYRSNQLPAKPPNPPGYAHGQSPVAQQYQQFYQQQNFSPRPQAFSPQAQPYSPEYSYGFGYGYGNGNGGWNS